MGYGLRGFLVVVGVAVGSTLLFGLTGGLAWGDKGERREGGAGYPGATGEGWGGRGPIVDNPRWREECGSCHMAFPPGLLPKPSWERIMAGLDKHFGENASVSPEVATEIKAFLLTNAAGAGSKVTRGQTGAEPPLRISETPWFLREHREISAATWQRKAVGSKANCVACHREAEKGIFDEHRVSIPK